MSFLSNLLSSLIPWLLAMMLICSLFILLLRFFAEPFAPGIEFGPLVRRLVNRRALEPRGPVLEVPFTASRQLRRRLRRNQWALHNQLRLLIWIGCVMLLSRLLILASAMVGSVLTGSLERLFTAAISHWVRWDASDYIDLARLGYGANEQLLVFLPLYPLVVKLFATLFMGHYVFAGFFVSNVCLMGSGWALYHIVNAQYGERSARRAVLLMMFAPLSLAFSVPYAESMFLMFTLLAVLFAKNHRFAWAGVFGMLSAATRLIGVLSFIPILMEALKYLHSLELRHRNTSRFFAKLGLYLLTSLKVFLGTGVYLIINRVVAGNPLAFIDILAAEPRSQSIGSIWHTQSYSIQSAFSYGDMTWQLGTWIPQALYIFAIALMILTMSTAIPPADGLYAWLYLVITMSPSWMLSGPRTLTSMYPLYIMLALISRKKWYYVALMVVSVLLLCFFGYMYALSGSVV